MTKYTPERLKELQVLPLEAKEGISLYEYVEEPTSDMYFFKTAYLSKTITVDTIKELYSVLQDKDIMALPHQEENSYQ